MVSVSVVHLVVAFDESVSVTWRCFGRDRSLWAVIVAEGMGDGIEGLVWRRWGGEVDVRHHFNVLHQDRTERNWLIHRHKGTW